MVCSDCCSLLAQFQSYLQDACDRGLDPDEFVEDMKRQGIRVPGIGHRIKSKVWHTACAAVYSLATMQSSVPCIVLIGQHTNE